MQIFEPYVENWTLTMEPNNREHSLEINEAFIYKAL